MGASPTLSIHRRIWLLACAFSLILLGAIVAPPVAAAPGDPTTTASGQFLGVQVVGVPVPLLTTPPAEADSFAGPTSDLVPLGLSAFAGLDVELPGGVQLIGATGILSLLGANQVALTPSGTSATGASGQVTDAGALGGPTNTAVSLDMGVLIPPAVSSAVADLQLDVGLLGANAVRSGGTTTGDYNIADVELTLNSPLVGDIGTGLIATVGALQPSVDALEGLLETAIPGASVTNLPDLAALVGTLTTVDAAGGSIVANLQTGEVSVNVDALLAFEGLDINNLGPNTELMPLVTAALTTYLLPSIQAELNALIADITAAFGAITVTVLGTPIPIPAPILAAIVTPVLNLVLAPISIVVAGLGAEVITPLAEALTDILSIELNGQQTTAENFTETALSLSLLPGFGTPIADVDLAAATVGVGVEPAAPPTVTGTLSPDTGPLAGGNQVSITGTGFTPDTVVLFDGSPITPDTIAGDGTSLTFTVPGGSTAGVLVPVSVSNLGGDAPTPGYTYAPPTVTVGGTHAAGASIPVTGTGWPANTLVSLTPVDGATPIGPTFLYTTDATGALPAGSTFTTNFATPAGSYSLAATDGINEATDTFTLTAAVPTATGLSPDSGPLIGGTVVTVTGTNFTPTSVVSFDGAPVTPTSVAADGTSLTFTVPPGTLAGLVPVSVTTAGGTASTPGFTYLPPSVTVDGSWPAGTPIPATGGGWPANTVVTLQPVDGSAVPVGPAVTVTTDAAGAFPAGSTFTVTAGTPDGTYSLTALDSNGNVAADDFQVAAPTVVGPLSPDNGPLPGGTEVTVTGTGFVAGTVVIFDGDTVVPTSIAADGTSLTFLTPAGPNAVLVPVAISNPGGTVPTAGFTFDPPALLVTGTHQAGTDIPVTGAGWPPNTTVTLVPVDGTATPIGPPVIVTTDGAGALPAGTTFSTFFDTPAGTYTLTGTDANGNTAEDDFDLIAAVPTVVGPLSPDNGPLPGGTVVTITGTNFTPDTEVDFNGTIITPATIAADGTSLTFVVPPGTTSGVLQPVTVTNAGGDAPTPGYTYDPPTVTVDGSHPAAANIPAAGAGWQPNTTVTITPVDGATPIGPPVTVTTDATGAFPAGTTFSTFFTTPAGSYTLSATDGTNTAEDEFDLTAVAPTVTGDLSPDTGPLLGGTAVVITGTGFTPDAEVSFGGTTIPADSVAVDGTSLTFTVPPGTQAGVLVPVSVVTDGGTAPTPGYTYDQPTVTVDGTHVAGSTIPAAGDGWLPGSAVTITPVSGVTPIGAPVLVTIDALGAFPVGTTFSTFFDTPAGIYSLTATDGTNTAADGFDLSAAVPTTVGPLSPANGPLAGGTVVTISGTNFTPDTEVDFNGTLITPVIAADGTSLTFTVPPGTEAGVPLPVSVVNDGGTAATPGFTYDPPTVTVDGASPAASDIPAAGAGWPPGATVTLQPQTAGGDPVGPAVTVTTTAIGEFPADTVFTVDFDTPPGTYTLSATDGTNTATDTFEVTPSIPTFIGPLSPDHGPLPGGTVVTISGTNFTPDTVVEFAGATIVPTGFAPDGTSLTFVVPPGTQAGVPVTVNVVKGEITLPTPGYTYDPPAVSVGDSAPTGTPIPVDGAGWPPNTPVTITPQDPAGNPVGDPVTVTTTPEGTFPLGTAVTVDPGTPPGTVVVHAEDGNGNSADAPLEVGTPPTSSALSPSSGPLAGGTVVTITGTGFVPGSVVIFDGLIVTPDSISADGTTIVFTTPPGAVAGPVDVVVSNQFGDTEPQDFSYLPPTVTVPDSNQPGTDIPVGGGGWPPNTPVILTPTDGAGNPVGPPVTVITDDDGNLPPGTVVSVPVGTPAGDYVLVAVDANGNTATALLRVAATPGPTPGPGPAPGPPAPWSANLPSVPLAYTGIGGLTMMIWAALGLLVVGGGVLLGSRRRSGG